MCESCTRKRNLVLALVGAITLTNQHPADDGEPVPVLPHLGDLLSIALHPGNETPHGERAAKAEATRIALGKYMRDRTTEEVNDIGGASAYLAEVFEMIEGWASQSIDERAAVGDAEAQKTVDRSASAPQFVVLGIATASVGRSGIGPDDERAPDYRH